MNARIHSRIAEDITDAAVEISRQYQAEASRVPDRIATALSFSVDGMPPATSHGMSDMADNFLIAADALELEATRLRQMAEGLSAASLLLQRGLDQ